MPTKSLSPIWKNLLAINSSRLVDIETDLINRFENGDAQIGVLSPFGYLLASENGSVEAAFARQQSGSAFYGAQFIVRSDAGFLPYFDSVKNENTADVSTALVQFLILELYQRGRNIRSVFIFHRIEIWKKARVAPDDELGAVKRASTLLTSKSDIHASVFAGQQIYKRGKHADLRVAILETISQIGFGCRRDSDELIASRFFQIGDKDFVGIQCVWVEGAAREPRQGSKDF